MAVAIALGMEVAMEVARTAIEFGDPLGQEPFDDLM